MGDMMTSHAGFLGAGGVAPLLAVVTLVGAALALTRSRLWPPPPEDPAVQLLRRRLASGEISDEEYLRRRSALE